MNATPSVMLACATASRKAGRAPTTAAVTAPAAAATTTPPPTATAAKSSGCVDRDDVGRKGVQGGPPGSGVAPLARAGTAAPAVGRPAPAADAARPAGVRGGARNRRPATRPHTPLTTAVARPAMENMVSHIPVGTQVRSMRRERGTQWPAGQPTKPESNARGHVCLVAPYTALGRSMQPSDHSNVPPRVYNLGGMSAMLIHLRLGGVGRGTGCPHADYGAPWGRSRRRRCYQATAFSTLRLL